MGWKFIKNDITYVLFQNTPLLTPSYPPFFPTQFKCSPLRRQTDSAELAPICMFIIVWEMQKTRGELCGFGSFQNYYFLLFAIKCLWIAGYLNLTFLSKQGRTQFLSSWPGPPSSAGEIPCDDPHYWRNLLVSKWQCLALKMRNKVY